MTAYELMIDINSRIIKGGKIAGTEKAGASETGGSAE